jgi:putative toxin-antitoxin system antitoxin component (TIGR02293 family)
MRDARQTTRDLTRFKRHMNGKAPGPHYFAGLLGLQVFEWPQLLAAIGRGLPYAALEHLRENAALPEEVVLRWVQLARRTAERRKRDGRFQPDESDRLLRAARILAKGLELFEGDRQQAVEWLLHEQPALGGSIPLEVARTEVGAREVENLIGRLEHGVYS